MKFITNKNKITKKIKKQKEEDKKFEAVCRELEAVVDSWKKPVGRFY